MSTLLSKLPLIARLVLGLIFFVFGLNGFLGFLPMPPLPEAAGAFMGGLAGAGYFFPLLKATEVVGGLLLLSGFFVPLALTVLAPVVVQIAAFHLFLTPGQIGMSVVLVVLEAYLAWSYRQAFAGVLSPRAQPVAADEAVPAARLAAGAA